MALRYKIEGVPRGMVPDRELTMAPALRAPHMVKFRPESAISKVAAEVLSHHHVQVVAAMGAGKTTRLPHALALKSGKLVIYITANRLLAISVFNRAVKCALDDSTIPPLHKYYEKVEEQLPRTGVLYCGVNEYVSMLLRMKAVGKVLAGHVLVLDEAHACDAWTYVARKLSLSLGALHLVEMSATFDPNSNVMRETPGVVQEHMFVSEPMDKWRVHEKHKPWTFTRVLNNVVVYTDSRIEANHMMREYELCGFAVHRLVATTTEADFEQAMSELNNKKGVLVALIVDSSFRDGFTFDASVALDSGRVGFYKCVGGVAVKTYRELYQLERKQTAGRFARISQASAAYYYPDVAYPAAICDLAPLDMEVAAYVYRLLGYMPGSEFVSAIMREAVLPAEYDFGTVVNSSYPMQSYVVDASGKPRTPPPSYADVSVVGQAHALKRDYVGSDVGSNSGVSSGANRGVESACGSAVEPLRARGHDVQSAGDCTSGGSVVSTQRDCELVDDEMCSRVRDGKQEVWSAFETLRDRRPGRVVLEPGQYCHVSTLPEQLMSAKIFPRGLDSVDKYFPMGTGAASLGSMVASYPVDLCDGALELVVARYNTLNAYMRAMECVMRDAKQESWAVDAGPKFYDELERMVEDYNYMESERLTMLVRVKALADGRHFVVALNGDVPAELDYAEELRAKLKRLSVKSERSFKHSIDRMTYDAQQMTIDGGVSRRSLVESVSVELTNYTRYEVDRYQLPWWSGCKEVKKWHDERGRCFKSEVELNNLGEFVMGYRKKQRRIAIPENLRVKEID